MPLSGGMKGRGLGGIAEALRHGIGLGSPDPGEQHQPVVKYEDPGGPPAPGVRQGASLLAPQLQAVQAVQAVRTLRGFATVLPGTKIVPFIRAEGGAHTNALASTTDLIDFRVPESRALVVTRLSYHTFTVSTGGGNLIEQGVTNPFMFAGALRFEYAVDGSLTSPGQYFLRVLNGGVTTAHGAVYAVGQNFFGFLDWNAMNPGFVISPSGSIKTRAVQIGTFGVGDTVPALIVSAVGGFLCPPSFVSDYLKAADGE